MRVRGSLTSRGAGGGRGRGRREGGESHGCHSKRDMQKSAIPLQVVFRLLLLPAAAASPRCLPALRSLGPVNRRGALAPAAAHADPKRGLFLCRGIGPAGSLLGPSTAAEDGCGLPAAGLQADLDLSKPGLAYRGSAQQARAAHLDPQTTTTHSLEPAEELGTPRLSSSLSLGSLSSFPDLSCAHSCSFTPSLPPSFFFFLSHSLPTAAVMMLCLHSQATQGLRQPSVQFRADSLAPSMHTICFNTSTCSHNSVPLPSTPTHS